MICLDLNLPTAQERSFEEWTKVLHEKVLAEHRTEATGDAQPRAGIRVVWDQDWDNEPRSRR